MASEKKLLDDCYSETKMAESSSLPVKGRRKISVTWFRQSSFGMSLSRLRLPRQHTIATELIHDEECHVDETIPENGLLGVSFVMTFHGVK